MTLAGGSGQLGNARHGVLQAAFQRTPCLAIHGPDNERSLSERMIMTYKILQHIKILSCQILQG